MAGGRVTVRAEWRAAMAKMAHMETVTMRLVEVFALL